MIVIRLKPPHFPRTRNAGRFYYSHLGTQYAQEGRRATPVTKGWLEDCLMCEISGCGVKAGSPG